jgi:hypothetical protein
MSLATYLSKRLAVPEGLSRSAFPIPSCSTDQNIPSTYVTEALWVNLPKAPLFTFLGQLDTFYNIRLHNVL